MEADEDLQQKLRDALEEVHHLRDRVKKLCDEVEQVPAIPCTVAEPKPPMELERASECHSRLQQLLAGCEEAFGPLRRQFALEQKSQPDPDRKGKAERQRRLAAEKSELHDLEQELQLVHLQSMRKDLQLGSGPSGLEKTEQDDSQSGLVDELGVAVPKGVSLLGKAKAPGPPPGHGNRSPRGSLPKPPPPKAKGKGPGAAPPPSKAKARSLARAFTESEITGLRDDPVHHSARLVNLHWRASQGPPEETEIDVGKDGYLQGMANMMDRWDLDRTDRMRQSITCFENRVGLSAAKKGSFVEEQSLAEPKHGLLASGRRRRRTVFNGMTDVPVPELQSHQLEEFFQARAASFDICARASCATDVTSLIVDSTHQRILDLMVRGAAIHKQDGVENAVSDLLAALLSCDTSRLSSSVLSDLRKVVPSYVDGSNPSIVSFVDSRGVEALSRLEHPHLHHLLYGVVRIPAIVARLECMAFVQKFPEELETCKDNLESLRRALVCICNRLPALRRFWATVLQAGNALNSGSMANTTERGFRLASISKLLDLRSPLRRDVSLFHFVLLHLQASDVQDLCSADFVEALQSAYLRRGFTVHHDTISHLEGFRHIESLVETGTFKGEKIAVMPAQNRAGADAPVEHGDPFFSCMRDFAATSREACADIWSLNAEIQRAYKQLSLFFDDPAYVYPPPKDDQDGKRDLFGLLHSFVSDCVRVRQEIDVSDFPAEVRLQCRFTPPYLDSDSSDSSSEHSASQRDVERKALAETLGPAIHALRNSMPSPQRPPRTLSEGSPPCEVSAEARSSVTPSAGLPPAKAPPALVVSPTLLTSPDKKGPLLSGPCKMEMPSVPPPDRAPKRASQGRSTLVLGASPLQLSPGTGHPQALSPVLPTTPGSTGSRQCRTPEPVYDRLARKSLTRQVDRDCAECLGASAARIRGDSGSSLNYTSSSQTSCLSPVSSGSGESARSSICPSDLKTQLRDVWKRRTHTGGREAEPPRALRSPSPAEAAWLSMELSATTPRRSRTTSLSPVKEQGETPHRPVICQ